MAKLDEVEAMFDGLSDELDGVVWAIERDSAGDEREEAAAADRSECPGIWAEGDRPEAQIGRQLRMLVGLV